MQTMISKLLAYGFVALILFACKAADVTGSGPDTTIAKDSVNVEIFNRIDVDPGPLTFKFFNKASSSLDNPKLEVLVGTVAYSQSKSKTFRIPVGSYRMGYVDGANRLIGLMESQQALFNADAWPVETFVKNKSYILNVYTTESNYFWQLNSF